MSSHRLNRVKEEIQREVTNIIRTLRDPRLTRSLISVVKVDINSDFSVARIFISSYGGIKKCKLAVDVLNSAKGLIRNELCSNIKLKVAPYLIFIPTDSIEYATHISEVLKENLN